MKLAELIYEHDLCLSAEKKLDSVDWNFDVNGVEGSRFARGQKAMDEAQSALKELYRHYPESAELLWQKHCPYARPGVMPTWVLA